MNGTLGLDLAKDVFQVHCISDPPILSWSGPMIGNRRVKNENQATQTKRECHEVSAS